MKKVVSADTEALLLADHFQNWAMYLENTKHREKKPYKEAKKALLIVSMR